MLLLPLVLMVFLNARLARVKGRNSYLWGFITFLAFFAAYAVLGSIYVAMIYKGPLTKEALTAWLGQSIITQVMLMMIGIGGTLIVRFILERKERA